MTDRQSLRKLLDFLACSFGGGTDVASPLRRALQVLEDAELDTSPEAHPTHARDPRRDPRRDPPEAPPLPTYTGEGNVHRGASGNVHTASEGNGGGADEASGTVREYTEERGGGSKADKH